jgi:hypothetical protein
MNKDDKAPEWFKKLVPARGSLAASELARIIKDLRRRKIKPFYYEGRKQHKNNGTVRNF